MMLFVACLLTVLIETPLLYLWGWRDRGAVIVVVCGNVISNLLLNLTLLLAFPGRSAGGWIYLLEALVVAGEYAVYALFSRPSWKLLLQTFAANLLSYALGLLIF